ncbi:MAG: hypothetical protein HC939_03620 [Pleurocapsa sp. SU_5_0]|nr:hypothetical protein [Pleurocapsa sp. CCALA 161]NJK55115.1 hypothetical protein [Pleurocapsa sp. SU_5_0]NJO97708.1 hypothetical protein [Pleurocapsa sp. CRU_1_2]NJR46827.1 hypothetical protein [Hyellaceae cyanobacterium CSU_1_1]
METNQLLNTLFLVAIGILGLLSLGVGYLSVVQWRDRRRQGRDKRGGL